MKKLFFFLFVFGLMTALSSFSKAIAESPGDQWRLNLGLGVDLPGSNWQPAYNLGWGGSLGLSYSLDPSFTLGLNLEDYSFSGTNWSGAISDNEFRLLPLLKFYPHPTGLRPYLLAGLGVDMEFLSSSVGNGSLMTLDPVVGAGLELPLGGGLGLFVEGQYNFLVFNNGTTTGDVPLQAGLVFDLGGPASKPAVVYLTVKTVKDETVITGFARGENEFEFKEGDLKGLKEIVDYLLANPARGLTLTGYTDPVGDDALNAKLSLERARWLEQYLLKMGLPAARILSVKGLGAKDPVGDNRTEEGMALNRRVVVRVTEKDK